AGRLREHSAEREQRRRHAANFIPQLMPHVIIRAVQLALVVFRDQEITDDKPGEERSEYTKLKIRQIAAWTKHHERHDDKRHRADFSRHDRSADGIPRKLSPPEEEIADRILLPRL